MISFFAFVTVPTWLAILWRKYLAKPSHPLSGSDIPRSILVVRLDQLGDLVLTTPLFRELKRLYPGTRITLVVPPQFKAIFTTNRHVDEIITPDVVGAQWLPTRLRQLVSAMWFYRAKLRQRQFDLVISPRWDVDEDYATLFCVLANAKHRAGHSSQVSAAKRRLNRWFDAAFDIVVPPGPLRHEVDRNLAIVEALGGEVADCSLEICLTASDRACGSELLRHHDKQRLLVAIGVGGRAASRKWPLGRYAEALTQLNRLRPVQPVIVCSGDENAEASALSLQLPVPPYILSGLPLRAVCAVLQQCQLFVGNDTGTAHLAAAMHCPTVVVSRHPANGDPSHANSPIRFAPRDTRVRVLQPATGVGECAAWCNAREPHCILSVMVEEMVAAATELILGHTRLRPETEARGFLIPQSQLAPTPTARPA